MIMNSITHLVDVKSALYIDYVNTNSRLEYGFHHVMIVPPIIDHHGGAIFNMMLLVLTLLRSRLLDISNNEEVMNYLDLSQFNIESMSSLII